MLFKKDPPPINQPGTTVGTIGRNLHLKRYIRLLLLSIFIILAVAAIYKTYPSAKSFALRKYHELTGTVPSEMASAPTNKKTVSKNNQPINKISSANKSGSQNTASNTQTAIYCGVSTMPKDVCDVSKSIEADGLKNNPGVVADVSDIPDGTKISIDYGSWSKTNSYSGQINGTASVYGIKKTGKLAFRLLDSGWKVIQVTVN